MATAPNYGKGRNLKSMMFSELTEVLLMAAVNDWLVALTEEEIVFVSFDIPVHGTPAIEHMHAFFLYTEE